jgi:DNA repair protein RecN (Recombination protein N)
MLNSLTIRNLAIAKNVNIDFTSGMNTITGETGAGKSIMLDALGLTLGNKVSTKLIGQHGEFATITSVFSLEKSKKTKEILVEKGYCEENDEECILKRIISKNGKNKAFINGTPCTVKELKDIGNQLIEIHGQHEHHKLLKKDYQLSLLDAYGNTTQLYNEIKNDTKELNKMKKDLAESENKTQEKRERKQLLEFQFNELETLKPSKKEFQELEEKQKNIENHQTIQENVNFSLENINNENTEFSATSMIKKGLSYLNIVKEHSSKINIIHERLEQAIIDIDDIEAEIVNFLSGVDIDEEDAAIVTERYNEYNKASNKYKVMPEELEALYNGISKELIELEDPDQEASFIKEKILEITNNINNKGECLVKKRIETIQEITPIINNSLEKLGFKKETFSILMDETFDITNKNFNGFFIAPNVGQEPQLMSKSASGGELSRISLAIQVTLSKNLNSPSIIFDEVDVGIGGETANIVGELLKELSKDSQIICITHLPQVACYANNHLKVKKTHGENETTTEILNVLNSDRKMEIARMLYGEQFTKNDLERASLMLDNI